MAIAATANPLQVGTVLPALSGVTLSGKPLNLPDTGAGRGRVLVFSFSKAASADSRLWSERLARDLGPGSPAVSFRVILLESVPRLFRGMAKAGIKSGVPRDSWDRTILCYKDEDICKKRLGVTIDTHSYVVLLDGEGRICWMSSGPFTDSEYSQLRKALTRLRVH